MLYIPSLLKMSPLISQWSYECYTESQTPMAQQHQRESQEQQHRAQVTGSPQEVYGQADVEGETLRKHYDLTL